MKNLNLMCAGCLFLVAIIFMSLGQPRWAWLNCIIGIANVVLGVLEEHANPEDQR